MSAGKDVFRIYRELSAGKGLQNGWRLERKNTPPGFTKVRLGWVKLSQCLVPRFDIIPLGFATKSKTKSVEFSLFN